MYYVYKIIDSETNEFYYGSRKYEGDDINKDKYMGSPYIWKPNIENLIKIIIKNDFKTMEDTILYERDLIIQNIDNPLNRNYSIPNGRFHRVNLVTAISKKGKIVSIHRNDPLFGIEYTGVTKGMVLAKDIKGEIFFISKNDKRYKNGELVHNNKGNIPMGTDHPNWS